MWLMLAMSTDWIGSLMVVSTTGIVFGNIRENTINTKKIQPTMDIIITDICVMIFIFAIQLDR